MDGVSNEDFLFYNKAILDRLDEQSKKSEEMISEFKKIVQTFNDSEKREIEKEKQEEAKERARVESGEKTTDEKILSNLESVIKTSEEQNKVVGDLMSNILEELKVDNDVSVESQKNLKNLVLMQEDQAKVSKEQTNLVVTYGVVLIPTILFLYFMYKFFRQFI